jgi:hypothetical protein
LSSALFGSSPDFFLENDVRYFSNFHGAFLSTRLVVPYSLLIFGQACDGTFLLNDDSFHRGRVERR